MKITKKNKKSIIALICFLSAGSIFQINEIVKIAKSGDVHFSSQKASVEMLDHFQ